MGRRLVALGVLAALGAGVAWLALGRISPQPGAVPLELPDDPRVLVFAPHPDDETLAMGGLVSYLARRETPVRVVFITNGDGWPFAVMQDLDVAKPTFRDYLALGDIRQGEARMAARALGLGDGDLRFLGFPDGGLAALWRTHWAPAVPYVSPYTRRDRPPYHGTGAPEAEYDGEDLTSMIARQMREFRPTVIVMPSPWDTHPDHEHTGYFVAEALDELQTKDVLPRDVEVLTYVVHHPAWPLAPRDEDDPLTVPPEVPDTRWAEQQLAPEDRRAKEAALAAYRSQVEVCPQLLRFLRPNELLGRVKSRVLDRIAATH
jgi:LmbE family N-acetylglucosaminyl deacetylase